jgi:hypothetical protein
MTLWHRKRAYFWLHELWDMIRRQGRKKFSLEKASGGGTDVPPSQDSLYGNGLPYTLSCLAADWPWLVQRRGFIGFSTMSAEIRPRSEADSSTTNATKSCAMTRKKR